jgi:hypothetical protein
MNFDFADFSKGLSAFKSLFTFKHITVLVFVALALVLVCAPHRDNAEPFAQTCNDASCPFPRPKVITVAPVFITKISLENWQLDIILHKNVWCFLSKSRLIICLSVNT